MFPLDKSTLKLLRDLHLLVVLPERDDAAGRVGDVRDPGGVGLDAVHAGAGQEVPHTQQPVLRQGGGAVNNDYGHLTSGYLGRGARSHPAVSVQEERGDGAGVAVERVDRGAGVRAEHAHRVVRRARDQPRVVQPHAADRLAVRAARHRPGKRDLGQDS